MSINDKDKDKDEDSSKWKYAGLEEEWDSFDRRITRYMRKRFDKFGEDMWSGFIPNIDSLSGESYGIHCERVYRAIEINNPTKAWALWTHDSGFWGREWQKDWIEREYNLLLDYIEDHSEGQALLELVNFSGAKSEIRKHLYKQFGSGTGGDIHTKELEFDNGMPEPGKNAFVPGMDMTVKLRELEARRLYFWKMCKPDKRATYLYCQESKLVRIVLDKINSDYDDCISRLLDYVRMTKMIQSSSSGGPMEIDTVPDWHDRSFSDDWLPPWRLLQTCLITEYKKMVSAGKFDNLKNGRSSDKLPIAALGMKEIKCFACGGKHKKGDPECKAGPYDVHPCAPETFRARQAAKKRKAEEAGGNGPTGLKKAKIGDKIKPCFNFAKGSCQYGAKCKFSHDPSVKAQGSSSVMLSAEQEELVRTMVASALKQSSKTINNRIRRANKKNKKKSESNRSDADTIACVVTALLAPSPRTIPRWTQSGSNPCLVIKLHDVDNNIGVDSDAAVSISCFRDDFLWLDESEDDKGCSSAPTGIGGEGSRIAGIGPMIVRAHSGEYIICPKAAFMCPGEGKPVFRLLSVQRLKSFGVRSVGCFEGTDRDVLQDRYNGKCITLTEDGPRDKTILVMSTVPVPRIQVTPCLKRLVREIQEGKRTAMVTDLQLEDRQGEAEIITLPLVSKALITTLAAPLPKSPLLVFNIAKCTVEERSRLFVRRFGGCDSNLLVRMSKDPDFGEMPQLCSLNEDNIIKDAAKFRKLTHLRIDPEISQRLPTWWRVYADAYGGGQSMGMESYEGAIGGYLFKCPSSGEIVHKLYSSHEQFPAAVFQFLVQVEAEGHRCHEIYMDTHSVNLSNEVEEVVALFQCRIVPVSAGTPQEVSFVETAHRVIAARSRAMLLGAPHLPGWAWALADKHAVLVGRFLPQSTRQWKCSYFLNTGRPPPWRSLCIHVFGAPCRYAPMSGPVHKRAELTCEGYYVGTQHPMALVLRKHDLKLISCSTKKISVYESPYIAPLSQVYGPILEDQSYAETSLDGGLSLSSPALHDKNQVLSKNQVSANGNCNLVPGEVSVPESNISVGDESVSANELRPSPKQSVNLPTSPELDDSRDGSSFQNQAIGPDFIGNQNKKDSAGLGNAKHNSVPPPRSIQSIKSMNSHIIPPPTSHAKTFRGPTLLDASADSQALNPGEGDVVPEHLSYELDLSAGLGAMLEQAKKIADPKTRARVIKNLQSSKASVEMEHAPKQLKKGKARSDTIDMGNVVQGKRVKSSMNSKRSIEPVLTKPSKVFPLQVGDGVSADPKLFDGHVLGSYSSQNPDRRLGVIKKKWKGYQSVDVEWLDGTTSRHDMADLRLERPKTTAVMILAAMLVGSMKKADDHMDKTKWPKDFYHALVRPDWRHWVNAVKKEIDSWLVFNAYTEIPFSARTPGASIVPLGELFTRKRDESYKFRQYLMGHLLKKGKGFR